MSKCSMIQVNRVYLKIIFINHPQFFVVSNDFSHLCIEDSTGILLNFFGEFLTLLFTYFDIIIGE